MPASLQTPDPDPTAPEEVCSSQLPQVHSSRLPLTARSLSRAVLARVRSGHSPGAPPDAEGANVATCPCCGCALSLAPAPEDPTRPAAD